jgi:tetratricopeptide (TPR) repeat protein
MTSAADHRSFGLGALVLIALTFLAYSPVFENGFIWDDDAYVTANPTLADRAGLVRIWLDPRSNSQYYPMVFTTFFLERRLWGLDPAGYHGVNVALHAANAVLALAVLRRLGVPGAWLAGALFAIHPVEVESVAWVTERKNVLSCFFALGAVWAYLQFENIAPTVPRDRPSARLWGWYGASVGLFVLALLSKTVTAMLAPVLVLVLWWRRERLDARELAPLAPFFALGAALGLNTARLEVQHVGAFGADFAWSPAERLLLAGRAVWFYASTLLVPWPLIFIYPQWRLDPAEIVQWIYPGAVAGVVLTLAALRNRIGKGPLVAWVSYVVLLFPALGFFNVYPMRYSLVADHFQYHASLALFAAVAAGLAMARPTWPKRPSGSFVASLPLLIPLGFLTWSRCWVYHDEMTLWNDTLVQNPSAWIAHENLANRLLAQNRVPEAIAHFERALALRPNHAQGYSNLGNAYLRAHDPRRAIATYQRGLAQKTDEPLVRSLLENNLGSALGLTGDLDSAIRHFQAALALNPLFPEAHTNLAMALAARGQTQEAIEHLHAALRLNPKNQQARDFLNKVSPH